MQIKIAASRRRAAAPRAGATAAWAAGSNHDPEKQMPGFLLRQAKPAASMVARCFGGRSQVGNHHI